MIMYNRLKVDTTEAVFVLLKRFAYPCRFSDMVPRFAKPVPELCVICYTETRLPLVGETPYSRGNERFAGGGGYLRRKGENVGEL